MSISSRPPPRFLEALGAMAPPPPPRNVQSSNWEEGLLWVCIVEAQPCGPSVGVTLRTIGRPVNAGSPCGTG